MPKKQDIYQYPQHLAPSPCLVALVAVKAKDNYQPGNYEALVKAAVDALQRMDLKLTQMEAEGAVSYAMRYYDYECGDEDILPATLEADYDQILADFN